jgi:hypothetical protein
MTETTPEQADELYEPKLPPLPPPTPPPPSAQCPVCDRLVTVINGYFRKHLGINEYASSSCPGTNTSAPDIPTEPNPVGE